MSENFSMVASHSKRIHGEDPIFAINKAAMEAAKIRGASNVVNASIGALMEDDGQLSILPTVIDLLKNLPPEEYAAYAPIAGLPSFLEASKKAALGKWVSNGYIEAVATPGGSGAIRHVIWNYSDPGDAILTSDWYWGPYETIASEHGRTVETYTLFNDENVFNIKSFTEKVQELLSKQKRLVILLNAPAHNPTGYSLSGDEWTQVLDVLRKAASNTENKIILFSDVAYIDFAGDKDKSREFMKDFGNLPENILTVVAFSMSKGYTLYGMRCGAMMGISSNKGVAQEFKDVCSFSNRGVWSNGTRPAMAVLSKIFEDPALLAKVEKERKVLYDMLSERAEAFIKASGKANLTICPYKAGFFITIPCDNPQAVITELQKDDVFAVPLKKGIRFAVCSVSAQKCSIVPQKFVSAIERAQK